MRASAGDRMLALLAEERRALVHFDFAALDRLLPLKEALLVSGLPTPSRALAEAIHIASQENARLFEATLAGLRSAARRLDGPDPNLSTYGPDGSRAAIRAQTPSVTRRA